jgi:hypothetical protein
MRAIWSKLTVLGIAVATGLVLMVAQPLAASAAGPPFTQCPKVGQDPSCAILIVVNPDGSVSVLGDPSVGPYDGADDTLVGVQNNSTSYIQAITVTGPGTGLSEFDGDGLCSYSVSGCPFGPIGYEGPGVSFTIDPSQPDSAEVDFTGGGLAPGSSDYFSLEGALTTAVLTARRGGLGGYVDLGDSYSSGEGDGQYGWNSQLPNNTCHRSPNAYGPLLDALDHRRSKQSGLTGDTDLTSESGVTGDDLPVVKGSRGHASRQENAWPRSASPSRWKTGKIFPAAWRKDWIIRI